jgi:hypothetical protein
MDDLNETSTLYSDVTIEESDFVKHTIPLAAYVPDAKFYIDGWRPDNFR